MTKGTVRPRCSNELQISFVCHWLRRCVLRLNCGLAVDPNVVVHNPSCFLLCDFSTKLKFALAEPVAHKLAVHFEYFELGVLDQCP